MPSGRKTTCRQYALTHYYISDIIVGGNRDCVGLLGRSLEYSEGKDEESAIAISRFLCGSPRLCRLRTEG
jgi:hypothetical protein